MHDPSDRRHRSLSRVLFRVHVHVPHGHARRMVLLHRGPPVTSFAAWGRTDPLFDRRASGVADNTSAIGTLCSLQRPGHVTEEPHFFAFAEGTTSSGARPVQDRARAAQRVWHGGSDATPPTTTTTARKISFAMVLTRGSRCSKGECLNPPRPWKSGPVPQEQRWSVQGLF